YKPHQGDVFIVSYPKCGSTWMQSILFHIFSGGVPPKNVDEFEARTHFLEFFGTETMSIMSHPSVIKTHLPCKKPLFSEHAKYFYIARNPFDCCVSYYHHTKSFPAYLFEQGTFDQFFDMFLDGRVEFGDYFDSLLPWYERRHKPNVFFLTYEDLKRDTKGWVLRMADFLGAQYSERLRSDPDAVGSIIERSNIEVMKKLFGSTSQGDHVTVYSKAAEARNSSEEFDESVVAALNKPMAGDFVRKGTVGDWENYFSEDQVSRMKTWIAFKTAGSNVMELWKHENIP
ncbi:unnamed protein product, partial [Ixodes persulcatus]